MYLSVIKLAEYKRTDMQRYIFEMCPCLYPFIYIESAYSIGARVLRQPCVVIQADDYTND